MTAFHVAYSLDELKRFSPRNTAVTLGVFDGVHRGHRSIIETLIACRGGAGIEQCYVVTFDPHPVVVTHSRKPPPILSTIEERLGLMKEFEIDGVFVLKFDRAMADTHYQTFIDCYLRDALDMKMLVLGYDCHFGKNREGSPERVQQESASQGFEVVIVPPLRYDDEVVSSTHIRNHLQNGDLARANRLLGHPYTVAGRVVKGAGRGKEFGFPTANLEVGNRLKLWPARGVYAVRVGLGGRSLAGMMNVGHAPSVKAGKMEMEVHIFNFDEDIYGETVTVACGEFIRPEQAFPSLEALKEQLARDEVAARRILGG